MMMKSPSRNTRLLPTGGRSSDRLASIHCRKLNACRDCMWPPGLRMLRAARMKRGAQGMRLVRPNGTALGSAVLMLVLGLTGCSHLHWPWHKQPPPAPQAVHYLDVGGSGAAAALAQYWKRNTLVVDLT